jgi:hypothetical protein
MRRLFCRWFGHDYVPHVDARGHMTHVCLRCRDGWPK